MFVSRYAGFVLCALSLWSAAAPGAPEVALQAASRPASHAVQGAREFPVSAMPALADVYPERRTAFPDGVTGLADVVYSVLPGYRPLIVDLYLPKTAPAQAHPLVLFIHGGGWVAGHTRHSGALANFPEVLSALAAEGFVVASLEYRLAREAAFPAQLQDARAALRFLRRNAAQYGIDGTRVGVWGGSAGGHLAGLVATTCGDASYDPPLPMPPRAEPPAPPPAAPVPPPAGSECVQAAAIWYGVFDFTAMKPSPNTQQLLGCSATDCLALRARLASPLMQATKNAPPFVLLHGEADATVPVEQSRRMAARLKELGVPVEAVYYPGADHSFVAATPAATREATLGATNATFDFFRRVLLPQP